MFEELFGGGRHVGAGQLSGRELRIESDGLVEVLQRVLALSSFSARARPCRNSALASFDFVVMGILPASDEEAVFPLARRPAVRRPRGDDQHQGR